MSDDHSLRHLHLPPKGRPRWQARAMTQWDLTYLSWGLRWYGNNPLPLSCREGWTYMIYLDGSPTLRFMSGDLLKIKAGMGVIFHPDCVRESHDVKDRSCHVLGWIWRTPPGHALIQPPAGGYIKTDFGGDGLHQLEKIHEACRREVAFPCDYSLLALQKCRLELELCWLHSMAKPRLANQDHRIALARDFLYHHPHVMDPVKALSEYLAISPATIKRLFHTYFGKSPQAFALEQRMLRAREMLADGKKLVKEVAFELGYNRPNNFSRAYRRFFNINR